MICWFDQWIIFYLLLFLAMITLPPLPFEKTALEPIIDSTTLDFHYGKHHQSYVDKLNGLIADSGFKDWELEEIITTADGPIFNNAAQIWNHTFYWNCLRAPQANNMPSETLLHAILEKRWTWEWFKEAFSTSAINNFWSGRTWLVKTADGSLGIINTSNAWCPLTTETKPLLTIDVREHAYYLQYQNRRAEYIEKRWTIVNWDFVEKNYSDE